MKKWIQLIAMSLAVILLAGCNLIATDEVLNAQTTVLEINGEAVTKAELINVWSNSMEQQSYQAQIYGQSFDPMDASLRKYVLESSISAVISNKVVLQKGKELNLESFTEEELTELTSAAQSNLDYYASLVKSQFFASTALEGDALTEAINAKMTELGITLESTLDTQKDQRIAERVREETIKNVTIPAEELTAEYQAKVEEQKQTYTATPQAYADDMMNSATIYYVPAGFRYVKHVLLEFDSEASSAISTLNSELTQLRTHRTDLESSLSELEPAATEAAPADASATPAPTEEPLTEEQIAARTESINLLYEQIAQADADISTKEAALATAQDAAYAALQPKIEEVQAKIALGLNFDKVIESYGADAGMQSEPFKSTGYPVTEGMTTYDAAFQAASMALAAVGDVSEPVKSTFGCHIIKYVGDSVEGEIGEAAVSAALTESLLSTKQDETYDAELKTWIDSAKIKRYDSRMDFI